MADANVTADYGLLGLGPASGLSTGTFTSGAYNEGTPVSTTVTGKSGVYSGSLSAQGNMVAMQLNKGDYKYEAIKYPDFFSGGIFGGFVNAITSISNRLFGYSPPTRKMVPYQTGYLRQYWKDPTKCTFGYDSAIPAITGVVPKGISGMQGNFLYYMDLQITRVTGSNTFDIFKFLTALNQGIGFVTQSNNYLAALNNAQNNNLAYYGANDYSGFVSQGFDVYKQGTALITAIRNQGTMTDSITTGYFGTPNAVVNSLVANGLGYINNMAQSLVAAGVNFENIYDAQYTQICANALTAITNKQDLATIQTVMGSTIPNIKNALAYCSISDSSGLPNDSAFADMTMFGKDIVSKAPNLNYATGSALATLINNVQVGTSAGTTVNGLATPTSLIPQSVIDTLRLNLPTNGSNTPVSILNVMGFPSGYLIDQLSRVNNGIAALYATRYGPIIRQLLTDISRYDAGIALTAEESAAAASFVVVPPPTYETISDPNVDAPFPTTITVKTGGGPDYWETKRDEKIQEYFNVLQEVANDETLNIRAIYKFINENYLQLVNYVNYEYQNYNRANPPNSNTFTDNTQLFNFVQQLPTWAADSNNIGTDTLIYGMAQPNSTGDLIKVVMEQAKNNQILGEAGVRIKGSV